MAGRNAGRCVFWLGICSVAMADFGVWDLFHYLRLRLLMGWPTAWLEWDILFLIPWAWLGSWIAPAIVALVFAWWGARGQ